VRRRYGTESACNAIINDKPRSRWLVAERRGGEGGGGAVAVATARWRGGAFADMDATALNNAQAEDRHNRNDVAEEKANSGGGG